MIFRGSPTSLQLSAEQHADVGGERKPNRSRGNHLRAHTDTNGSLSQPPERASGRESKRRWLGHEAQLPLD